MLPLDGDRAATTLFGDGFQERNAVISPDGRWLAYNSIESGRNEVYVRPFPDVDDGRWQISTTGGEWPLWNPVDNELFYRAPTGIMAVLYETEPTFTPGTPTQLLEERTDSGGTRKMAVSPDGQRFLLLAEVDESSDAEIAQQQFVIVQNWFTELERLVPTE